MRYLVSRKLLKPLNPFVGRYIPTKEEILTKVEELNGTEIITISGNGDLVYGVSESDIDDALLSMKWYDREDQHRVNYIALKHSDGFYIFG